MVLLISQPKLFSEFILDHVVFDILTRFPVKSLIRFRCVSKSYNYTITSPIFITKHLNLNKSNNNHNAYLLYPLLPISDREFCAVVCNNNRTLTEISRFQTPFFMLPWRVSVMAYSASLTVLIVHYICGTHVLKSLR